MTSTFRLTNVRMIPESRDYPAPTPRQGYVTHCGVSHAEPLGECAGIPRSSWSVQAPYFQNIHRSDLGIGTPPLSDHVVLVLGHAAEEEVVGPNAWRIVALVENALPGRDRPVGNLPGHARGQSKPGRPVESTPYADLAVPHIVCGPKPFPAPISSTDLFPETHREGDQPGAVLMMFATMYGLFGYGCVTRNTASCAWAWQ
jgi:hypothetical protein